MSLQTVFVTNRNINIGKDRKKHLFGNELDPNGKIHFAVAEQDDKPIIKKYKVNNKITRTRKSIKKTYKLSLVESSDISSYLQGVVDNYHNGKPWVLFLHGNNQTLSKNLVKSRQIQDEYDVNMVIFSWPSRSYDPKLLPTLLLGGLLSANPPTKAIGKWIAKKAIKKKIRQYRIAQKYAEKTAPTFNEAFTILRDGLFLPLKQQHDPHTCFLVHSLGHHLLRNSLAQTSPVLDGYEFNTCLLHQADEEDKNHPEWIQTMSIVKNENTHITRNKKDIVLLMSGVVNNDYDVTKACTRLGNRWDRDSEQGSSLQYIDFTGMDDVGLGHGVAWDDGRSSEVDTLCRPIFIGN